MSTPVDLEAAPRVTFTEEWCLEMARKEGDSDVTAGVPEVDLEAARKLAEEATCGACMGTGVKDQDCPPEEVDDDIPCPECSGTGRHPLADLVLSLIPEAERARSLTLEVREGLMLAADALREWAPEEKGDDPEIAAALSWIEEHASE